MLRLLIVLSLLSQTQTPSVVRLYPIDDTPRDSSFRSYVAKLRSAVSSRRTDALRKLIADDVFVGPANDDKGWTKFVVRWHPDDPNDSRLWDTLSELLSLGFTREHPTLFVSPYLVWRFPRELNPARHLVVVRDKAALREAPSPGAPAAAYLSFDIVERLGIPIGEDQLIQWVPVRTLEGKSGYLNTRDVMSPMMPRAQFGLERGRWALIALERP